MNRTICMTRIATLAIFALVLTACSSGSDDPPAPPVDTPPSSGAGTDQMVTEKTSVSLGGSGGGSDTPLSYAWMQTGGAAATINNGGMASANFDAPDIAVGSDVLTFELTVTDSTGRTATDLVDVTVNDIAPSADAGVDQSVNELGTVTLTGVGAGSDTPLGYAWTHVSGPAITITDSDMSTASFQAPDVAATQVIIVRFTVADSGGRLVSDDIEITVNAVSALARVFGRLQYEDPAHNFGCDGINFNSITTPPIRGATVQLINANNQAVLQSTIADDNGDYEFANVALTVPVFVRVRAELIKTGAAPTWNMEVRDNTAQTGGVPALNQRPIYALDGPATTPTGGDNMRDMLAATGWTGSSFGSPRSAAPFSILDTFYNAIQLVVSVDGTANFAALDAFWSVNNTSAAGGNADNGEIGTSFYLGGTFPSLFLLGMDGDDIEEFDLHVIAHEWGHYFEDNFSRSDSIGGPHGSNDILDPRVSFGEGFATALSGMILDSDSYCDAFWFNGNLRGFEIDIESEATGGSAGWYNENSVLKVLYDLWDTDDDGADTSSLGFGPIYNVFRSGQATTTALTSVFSFGEAILAAGTGQNPFIEGVIGSENIDASGMDRWGTGETNNAGSANSLPVYTTIMPNGTPVNICSSGEFDSIGAGATGNKLNTHRFLQLEIANTSRYTFDIQADAATIALLPADDPNDPQDQSDPDMYYFRSGAIQNLCIDLGCTDVEGTSGDANSENFTSVNVLAAGTYVIDFEDWRYEDPVTDGAYPTTTCFDITVSPSP